jgi:hypothetical protein
LVSGPSVDGLAKQVGVPVVAGILLDHHGVDKAQAHLGFPPRVEDDLVQRMPERRLSDGFDLTGVNGEI